jgi:hypothetical protein
LRPFFNLLDNPRIAPWIPREVASLVNLYQETLAKARAEHPGLE